MNSGYFTIIVFVIVALNYGDNLAGILKRLADLCGILHAVVCFHIQSLMSEYDRRTVRLLEVSNQPLDLFFRNVRVSPLKVLSLVRFSVSTKTGVKHHEMEATQVE